MESSSYNEEGEVGEDEAGGEVVLLWFHHRSCKPCPARPQLQRQRLRQQEEGIVEEVDQEEVAHKDFLSVRPLEGASSVAS